MRRVRVRSSAMRLAPRRLHLPGTFHVPCPPATRCVHSAHPTAHGGLQTITTVVRCSGGCPANHAGERNSCRRRFCETRKTAESWPWWSSKARRSTKTQRRRQATSSPALLLQTAASQTASAQMASEMAGGWRQPVATARNAPAIHLPARRRSTGEGRRSVDARPTLDRRERRSTDA